VGAVSYDFQLTQATEVDLADRRLEQPIFFVWNAPIRIWEAPTHRDACVNNHIGCAPGVHSFPIGNVFLSLSVWLS
jgi:hypothetical protein